MQNKVHCVVWGTQPWRGQGSGEPQTPGRGSQPQLTWQRRDLNPHSVAWSSFPSDWADLCLGSVVQCYPIYNCNTTLQHVKNTSYIRSRNITIQHSAAFGLTFEVPTPHKITVMGYRCLQCHTTSCLHWRKVNRCLGTSCTSIVQRKISTREKGKSRTVFSIVNLMLINPI